MKTNKVAFDLLPSKDQVVNAVTKYAPPGLAAGAGVAGLVGVLAELRRAREQSVEKPKSNDTLEVQIPVSPKVAGVGNVLGTILEKINNLSPLTKTVAAVGAPAAVGALSGVKDQIQQASAPTPPSYLWQDALIGGSLAGGAALGYTGVEGLSKALRKHRAEQELEQAKGQYSKLLGQSLTGPSDVKTASFPLCEQIVRLMAGAIASADSIPVNSMTKIADGEGIAAATSFPALLGLAALVASHKFVYDREKDLDNAMAIKKVSPPKSIRLVAAPAAPVSPVTPETKTEEGQPVVKVAEGMEDLVDLAMLGAVAGKHKEKPAPAEVTPADQKPIGAQLEQIDPSKYRITTPSGAVVIDATDPATKRVLDMHKVQLAKIMGGVASLPEEKVAGIPISEEAANDLAGYKDAIKDGVVSVAGQAVPPKSLEPIVAPTPVPTPIPTPTPVPLKPSIADLNDKAGYQGVAMHPSK